MAFTFAAFSFMLALIMDAFLIFFSIFHIIAFDELKTDYKNPIEQCNTLNPLVLPEYIIHLVITLFFLLSGCYWTMLMNVPLLAYHIWRYIKRPMLTQPGIYDPTTIMGSSEMSRAMKEGWMKLAFYLVSFFVYLYCMIYELVASGSAE